MEQAALIREHLFRLLPKGIKYDLGRMVIAADRCGNPQNTYPSFHVAGTNGKGSTCAFIESCLRHAGHKTGMYVSPHIARFEERFQIDGCPIGEEQWLDVYSFLEPVIRELDLTFFEATTLMAFEIFRRERIAWAVFETGLGGRLDATNIVTPVVSVIARVALDHAEYLGEDVVSVAGEKLGIVKSCVPLVMALPEEKAVETAARERCRAMGADCHFVRESDAVSVTFDDEGATFVRNAVPFRIHLQGEFQVKNALLALRALECAGVYDVAAVQAGIAAAWLPGRFQVVVHAGKIVVFDVGHNPDAASVFTRAVCARFPDKTLCFVAGIMKDKDYRSVIREYCTVATSLLLSAPDTSRAATPGDLMTAVPGNFTGFVEVVPDVSTAVKKALAGEDDIVCITGSFYTVGEGMNALGIDPNK